MKKPWIEIPVEEFELLPEILVTARALAVAVSALTVPRISRKEEVGFHAQWFFAKDLAYDLLRILKP